MCAAVPGPPQLLRRVSKVAVASAAAALVGVACAPQGTPPTVPVEFGKQAFITQVVDTNYDVGRSPAVALDKDGNPSVVYLLYQPVLKKGAIPPPLLPNTPQPPSVVIASEAGNIWSRRNVTPNDGTGGKGTATEIADVKFHNLPGVTVAMAEDADGHHHAAWSTPSGLFYAVDSPVTLKDNSQVMVFSGKPEQVTSKATSGVSIAVDARGNPTIAYYQRGAVWVATKTGSTKWATQEVSSAACSQDCSVARTAVAVTPAGTVMVAFVTDQGALSFAQGAGGTWKIGEVGTTAGGGFGVSMTLGQNGPILAFYQKDGTVQVASESRVASAGAATFGPSWELVAAGRSSVPATTGDQAGASTTGVATDGSGNVWVTWADLSSNRVMLASAQGGSRSFKAQALPQSEAGWSPSLAVAGKTVAVAWYDSVDHRVDVSTSASAAPEQIAVPSPVFSPLPSPTGTAPPCLPASASATSLSISAKNIAFSTNCLAVAPNTPFTVAFDNADTTAHNFAIYTDSGATKLLGGAKSSTDIVAASAKVSYDVSALKPGIYFFRCDIHPTQMTGTFVVEPPGKGGSPSPSPTPSPSST